jgi:hypothetical protein
MCESEILDIGENVKACKVSKMLTELFLLKPEKNCPDTLEIKIFQTKINKLSENLREHKEEYEK